ncbi:rhamnulose-1-phosphate aldolase [Xylanimonas allomyrinae]|uniref:Rhamnulose-1-phosphate aldolase n=1 Tax=Xylanimonas allomyrinae TaxID=2509459 RepID=A0A4P6ESP0_9MICO|nr:class II aldolase/adducin family protein [Xylanimonas allomyrinae]QAY64569.1 rhamnulose-1-phosphate aldolase [Xylanimonas allomyrinae]
MTYDLNALLAEMGQAGTRLNQIDACEANAGNISVTVPTTGQEADIFRHVEPYALPTAVPALRGRTVLMSGSQQRLRDIADSPTAIVAAIVIDHDGSAVVRSAENRAFARPTSEANSHLAVHNDRVGRHPVGVHAVVHAHAPYTTTLSHQFSGSGADPREFTRQIMRWEPELVVHVPNGIGFLPFEVPGSKRLEAASVAGLRDASIVAWAKHGVLARSDKGPLGAVDVIEFIETGARFHVTARLAGSTATGLTDDELAAIIDAFSIETTVF